MFFFFFVVPSFFKKEHKTGCSTAVLYIQGQTMLYVPVSGASHREPRNQGWFKAAQTRDFDRREFSEAS